MQNSAIVSTALVGAAGLGYLAWKLGLWQEVETAESTVGPVVVVYKEWQGPYHKFDAVIREVADIVRANRVAATTPVSAADAAGATEQQRQQLQHFGMYFDKAHEVPPERCRASLGVMLAGESGRTEQELQRLADDINAQRWAQDASLKAAVLPAGRYSMCSLPYYGRWSAILGVWRAYSKLEVAFAVHHPSRVEVYGCLEVYDEVSRKMHVGFPLAVRDVLLPFQHADG